MKLMSLEDDSNFVKGLKKHQELLDVFIAARNKEGISEISQMEIASIMNRSQPWVLKTINTINTEDKCIEMVSKGEYIVHYEDLSGKGVFFEIIKLSKEFAERRELLYLEDNEIANERGIKIETVKLFKRYIRCHWW